MMSYYEIFQYLLLQMLSDQPVSHIPSLLSNMFHQTSSLYPPELNAFTQNK